MNNNTLYDKFSINTSTNFNQTKELYKEGNVVSIVNNPEEWARIVNSEKLDIPFDYNIFSNDLYFTLQPNEHIPILIRLLSYIENFKEDQSWKIYTDFKTNYKAKVIKTRQYWNKDK